MRHALPITATLLSCATLFAKEPVHDPVAEWNRANCTSNAVAMSKGKVRFLAQACGVDADATIEFAVCGTASDKDYETLFVSPANPETICKALETAGASRGLPPDGFSARFWPTGPGIKISVVNIATGKTNSLEDLISVNKSFLPEEEASEFNFNSIVYAGGMRLADGTVDTSVNSVSAILALYSLPQSPLLLQSPLDQSSTYGAFRAKSKMPKGELYEIILEVKEGMTAITQNALILPDGTIELPGGEKTPLAKFIEKSKNSAKTKTAEKRLMTFAFDRQVKLSEAVKYAGMLIDSKGFITVNGNAPGQIPLEAYLPDEKWRDRSKRPMQPLEIRLGAKRTATCIDEDWSGEGIEPKISERSATFDNPASLRKAIASLGEKAASVKVFFIYAPEETIVGDILDMATAASDEQSIFYVFAENKKQLE